MSAAEVHHPTEIGNAFGGYDCTCGEPWTSIHQDWAVGRGFYDPAAELGMVRRKPAGRWWRMLQALRVR
jgi:hypothetical protein